MGYEPEVIAGGTPAPGDKPVAGLQDARARLVLLSFLMLFLELALIRWTGSRIIYLSYFSNFVLLGSFLGIGLGFLRSRRQHDQFWLAPIALLLLVIFVRVFPVEIDRSGSQLIYFGDFTRTGLPTWVTLPLIFLVVAAIMTLVADAVGRAFARFEPLEAYRLDIIGSILGIAAFTLLSFLRAPPVAWGLVVGAIFVVLTGKSLRMLQVIAILGLTFLLLEESFVPGDSWSPYYRISVFHSTPGQNLYLINVNGIPHQSISSIADRRANEPIYFIPYRHAKGNALRDVLIVGAGNGTDVAIALSEGAQHVDAVEIDPRIQQIGAQVHPDHPYQDPRVTVHINDGRAFLEQTKKRYDLILFALPDSLTLVAGQSSLRLESYLFTLEAMQAARDHLGPDGVFGMYNYYREGWLVDRLAGTLDRVYGRPPCIDTVGTFGHFSLLTDGNEGAALSCTTVWTKPADTPAPARDDWPFVYLKTRSIPPFYLLTIALILAVSFLAVRLTAGGTAGMTRYADLFFMGSAFLLLETKNVVQFALLFGTTWLVNALVFSGVLLSVLAAVELARHVRLARPRVLYALLLASLVVAYAVPQHALLHLGFVPRFLAAVALAFAPIFVANLVFAQRFKDVGHSTTAFATNLLGAMVGGVLEYGALMTGYRALLIVVAVLYGLAFLMTPRGETAAVSA